MTRDDLQTIADLTAEALNIEPPRVKTTGNRVSNAWRKYHEIRLARWVSEDDPRARSLVNLSEETLDVLRIAEVVHEVSHLAPGGWSHGPRFRRIEIKAMRLWGLVPEDYARAYWRRLSDAQTGQILWAQVR